MAETVWQKRIQRAEELAVQQPRAAEILRFYSRLVRLQETIHGTLVGNRPSGFSDAFDSILISNNTLAFFSMVEEYGPARLADVALRLRSSEMQDWLDRLATAWSTALVPSEPEDFLARAFLQPQAEWVRSRLPQHLNGSSSCICPYCLRKPCLGVLHPRGDGGQRSLVCSFCCAEWEFRRIVCPNCGEEDNNKLPVYTANDFPHVRVECCDSCMTYIKTVDLTKNGLAEPIVDEIASVPLDLWAQNRAYAKLHPNLLGL